MAFVLRIGMGMRMRKGLKENEYLPQKEIMTYWKQFTAAYRKKRGPIPKEHVSSVTNISARSFFLLLDC
jgi:Ca2+-binding EF-hand superfamily protein